MVVPMAMSGRKGTVLRPVAREGDYEAVREWEEAYAVFASVYPIMTSQVPGEDGLQSTEQFRLCFCLPKGAGVATDDRVRIGDDTYRLQDVRVHSGTVNAVGVRV